MELSDSAEHEIDSIVEYIAKDLANPAAAGGFIDAVLEKIAEIKRHPYMYELSRNEMLAKRGYRRMVIDNYIALYLVDEHRHVVDIARVFYGKREYERYI